MLSSNDTDRIIEMAWEDRMPLEALEFQLSLVEKPVFEFMGRQMKYLYCGCQRTISHNKISKR
jgi:hypothetical protein